ncbi:unnamed protein product, partial [Anisakis simplex]|uniref:MORN repeat-containing protein n=1 Tax=Anisakis simplex TaxID=6269 RepID=A0A0M3IZD6_ANISI
YLHFLNCDCRDWYGGCKADGEEWTDEGTWNYECNGKKGKEATFVGKQLIKSGSNETINGFWFSCDINSQRIKYEQESHCNVNSTDYHVGDLFREGVFQWVCLDSGRWVTGCFYRNETGHWLLLKVGEIGYNGLIKHVCDRYTDSPGIVQYYAAVRDDIPHKSPPNKGRNKNLPDPIDNRLKKTPIRWWHANAAHFIENADDSFSSKIRYLPQSRKPWSK